MISIDIDLKINLLGKRKKGQNKKRENDIIGERDHDNNSYGWILSWKSIAHGQKEAPKNHLYLLGFLGIFVLP